MRYPTGINKLYNTNVNYKNRGMTLESDINSSNEYYLSNDIAVIYKKPTPITITKVDYPSRIEAVIKEAYFKTPSTTDYNGIYKGKYIDFEAKETKNKSSFPLNNIHSHQIKHLESIYRHGGIGFIIIRFTSLNLTYLLFIKDLLNYMSNNISKNIPLSFIKDKGYLIEEKYIPRLNYLKIIDTVYGGNYE